jgi:MYXO-CTERM domain-containing protein
VYLSTEFQVLTHLAAEALQACFHLCRLMRCHLHNGAAGESIYIDDLHFGALVPAPAGAALGLLALAGFAGRRRRTA